MKEITLESVLNLIEGTEYPILYRHLLGYEEHVKFYDGIDDSMEPLLDELQELVGFEIPGDLIQLYLISNGGRYFDINLYYLTADKTDKNGLYYQNVTSNVRKDYNIPDDYLIIGTSLDIYAICVRVDEEGYISYVLWDKDSKEIALSYDYLVEILMSEIDYYTEAFSDEDEE